MDFEVVVDSSLLALLKPDVPLSSENKAVLSLINGFEDGRWRSEVFENFVWDNISETALTKQERDALGGKPGTLLKQCAKNLRLTDGVDDISRGSELAEIVLYGILRHKYNALPVVPKIFYKQNAQDNAKGADSVHIAITQDDTFTLWFGEAKFYKSIADARLGAIIESVRNSLQSDKLKKENSIILNISELDGLEISKTVRDNIKEALSHRASIDDLKPRIVVPILLLHECAITNATKEADQTYRDAIAEFHKERSKAYFAKQVDALKTIHLYGAIKFNLILFPVPEKDPIVEKFVQSVGFYKK